MNHAVLSSFEQQPENRSETKGKVQSKIELSNKAIHELRLELQKKYNSDFGLNDEELNKIGLFLLTALMEGLKLENVV
ncbi:MAG: hypothetical protein UU10_C0004G0006 [Parcubacteria group bacterium GW2011_GWF1_40_6]|uniref:Uncharacterized protein n=2 Tax=Candidatus Nomuraibacteriota TaxID=1752729 RepID=A0A0G0QT72_9BACT|nr:MAG: hypothetical protein UT78_C0004G0008 [Candidatus Nomurabacteria bacterium GW2011_GWF2_40_12]KKR69835.1 MAG: hypothetical protein UU10_C0004G0006 [Parcubacteria group bacterium GW2011_GWF1_40_6]OGJ09438.1 MAG: hypothetical protein A2356_01145 [Candidatus Nomurabacteria bacterium RIFOXYB1_FULL_39_16]OGJ14799.1 MAG: hypothetical protein A2585_03980 [Candidatus Nomurabacteria bacterium RIFOXYD1_FULL_39_12]